MGTGSFIPSINVNSCIIEEQENHLVIAIRVPRRRLQATFRVRGNGQNIWSG